MVENRRYRYTSPRRARRIRQTAPQGSQSTTVFLVGGLIGGLLIVLLVATGQPSPARTAVRNAAPEQQELVSESPSPAATTTVPATTETAPSDTPEVLQKKAPEVVAVEKKPAGKPEQATPAEEPKEKSVAAAPERPRVLFPSTGISPLSHFVAGPEGQEGKADKIVRVVVESLKITRSPDGKQGYSLELRSTGFVKGRGYGPNTMESLTLGAQNGDPKKEFGLSPATAKGKKLVLFLKNHKSGDGSFSFFGLTEADYATLKAKVTAAIR